MTKTLSLLLAVPILLLAPALSLRAVKARSELRPDTWYAVPFAWRLE